MTQIIREEIKITLDAKTFYVFIKKGKNSKGYLEKSNRSIPFMLRTNSQSATQRHLSINEQRER